MSINSLIEYGCTTNGRHHRGRRRGLFSKLDRLGDSGACHGSATVRCRSLGSGFRSRHCSVCTSPEQIDCLAAIGPVALAYFRLFGSRMGRNCRRRGLASGLFYDGPTPNLFPAQCCLAGGLSKSWTCKRSLQRLSNTIQACSESSAQDFIASAALDFFSKTFQSNKSTGR